MKFSKIIVVLLLFVLSSNAHAQIQNLNGIGGEVLRESGYDRIDGSPYLFDKYKRAFAYDVDGVKIDVFAKYDSFKEEFEVHNGGNPIILDAKLYRRIQFNFYDESENRTVVLDFENGFDIPGYNKKDYFHVLKTGKVKVLRKLSTAKIEENEASYSGVNNVSSRFITKERFFLVKENNEVIKFKKIKNGTVLKAFNDKRITSYVKKKKMKIKTISDLEAIAEYYEGLD